MSSETKQSLPLLFALAFVVLGALMWVVVLRRRVHKQTEIIRQKLQVEATLKERYVELFENANEVVYTHDLSGRITSINKAGELLLQHLLGLALDLLSADVHTVHRGNYAASGRTGQEAGAADSRNQRNCHHGGDEDEKAA